MRKGKIRRFMVACKASDYDMAVLYLEQTGYDLDTATEAYLADEEWEASHPAAGTSRGNSTNGVGGGGSGGSAKRGRGFLRRRGA